MKLKKLTKLLLLISTALIILLGFTACGEEHVHAFSNWETVIKPTCNADGIQKRVCECGYIEIDAIDALLHTPVVDLEVGATCTEHGKTEGSHCGVCGTIIVAQTETDKVAHSFGDWETVTEATCTAQGLSKHTCECGYTEYKATDKKTHTPVADPAVGATCTEHGKTAGSHCGVCGTVIVAQTETDKLAHSFGDWETVTEATCTAQGLSKHTCECGYTEYKATDKKTHTPVADPAVGATCTEYGKTAGSHCGVCGTVIVAQEIILPFGHNCSQEVIIEEATCEKDGVKRIYCVNENCDHYCEVAYALETVSTEDIYTNASGYTGYITTYDRLGNHRAEIMGIVISSDGKILTSNLKLDGAFSAIFRLGTEEYEITEVLAYSTKSNIAVLKIDATDLPFANLCDKAHPAGETVYSFGTVENGKNTLVSGNITNTQRYINGAYYIQHDIDISTGLIGAPLINKFGEVIAVNIGYTGYSINLATPVSVISELDYENPMTLAEYGALTYSNYEQLEDWVYFNYNRVSSDSIYYSFGGSSFTYSIGYNTSDNHCFIDGMWKTSQGNIIYIYIILDEGNGVYEYRAEYVSENNRNTVCGYFDAATFNEDTVLTYDTFYGKYWPEDQLMQIYSSSAYSLIEWFSHCLTAYSDNLTLESFGFESLSFESDDEALDKLNSLVTILGTYNQRTGAYELSMRNNVSSGTVVYLISYTPENGDVAASTVITINLYTTSNEIYAVSIALDPTENGYRYDALYAELNGSGYTIMNTAWGYIEADTFTDTSCLEAYVFSGLDDYEDRLLGSYTYLTYELLSWTDILISYAGEGISIKDLGFLFFFG